MLRVILLLIGYCFGLFQTGYLYGRKNGIDIRKSGSGNAGATNTLRVLGKKAGLIVFFGDFLKCLIPCVATLIIFKNQQPDMAYLYLMYVAFGVILGHNYPCYLGFKGGKGIACTAGMLVAYDWKIMIVCLVLFIGSVAITRLVSLGSLFVVTAFFILSVLFASQGSYGLAEAVKPEFYFIAFVITALAYWRHKANIVRLLHGNENKIGSKR